MALIGRGLDRSMQDYTFEIESANEIRLAEKRMNSAINWGFSVGGIGLVIFGWYYLFTDSYFSVQFGDNRLIFVGLAVAIGLVVFVGGIIGTIALLEKIWPSGEVDELIATGIDDALDKNLPGVNIGRGERITSEDGKKLIEITDKNDQILLCRYLSRRSQLEVRALSISEINSIEYEFEPEEVKESYSNDGLFIGAGVMIGGVAGAIVGGVLGDLIDAGRMIKIKLRFTAIFNLNDGMEKTFDVVGKHIEFSPKSDSVLKEELHEFDQRVDSVTTFITKYMPGKLLATTNLND